jgi:hypothetical protein
MRALASRLERRPQLGQEVFARGQPEIRRTAFTAAHQLNVDPGGRHERCGRSGQRAVTAQTLPTSSAGRP